MSKKIELKLTKSKVVKNVKKQNPKWLKDWEVEIGSEIEAYYGIPDDYRKRKKGNKKSK